MNAICKLSIVPIRKTPSDESEQVSQLLFGEQVIIKSQTSNWYFIKCIHDEYEGFIDKKQLKITPKIIKDQYIVNVPFLNILGHHLTIGSYLDKVELKPEIFEPLLLLNSISSLKQTNNIDVLLKHSFKFLNAPYLWGGRSPFGIDCSGFTQMVFRLSGYHLRRDAYQQAKMGEHVASLSNLKSGDLAFFNKGKNNKITHVGIVFKENQELKVIHASGMVQVNELTADGIIDNNGALSHHYLFSRRIL